MKSNTNGFVERKLLDELHSDCKSWRRVASECTHSGGRIPPSTEEKYKVVHGRILARCRNLAAEELVPESRRHIAVQLDELLRPWPSAKSLNEAPPSIVCDLVKSQALLDERLVGKKRRGIALGTFGRLVFTACLAAAGGILIVLLLQWTSSNAAMHVLPVQGWLATITGYARQTSFTEHFAVAILISWLFGTWLLSRLSNN